MSKHQSSDQGSSRSRPPAGRHPGDHAPKSQRRAAVRARARRSTVKRSGKGPAEPERPPRAEKARTKSKKEKRHDS